MSELHVIAAMAVAVLCCVCASVFVVLQRQRVQVMHTRSWMMNVTTTENTENERRYIYMNCVRSLRKVFGSVWLVWFLACLRLVAYLLSCDRHVMLWLVWLAG